MSDQTEPVTCEHVREDMANVLDGSAAPSVLQHLAECDACRDARHDAERAALLVSEAGSDFAVPERFALRLAKPATTLPEAAPLPPPTPAPATQPKPAISAPVLALLRRWTVPVLAAAAAAAFLVGRGHEAGTSADDPQDRKSVV